MEAAGSCHDVSGTAGDHQIARVFGHTRSTLADLLGIADLAYFDDHIDELLRNAGGRTGIIDQIIGDDNDLAGTALVDKGVAERAAGVGADLTGGVAIFVSGGGTDESNIDIQFASFDGAGTGAVSAKNNGLLHQPGEHGIAKLTANTAGLNAVDRSVFHEIDDRRIFDVDHSAWGKFKMLDAE